MDSELFENSVRLNQNIKRNVVYVPPPKNIAQSLMGEFDILDTLRKATNRGRQFLNQSNPLNNFYYTTAIEFPFKTEPFMYTRYSDGTYPVWYGSKSIETTIYETAFHTIKHLSAIENYQDEKIISRKRSVYNVFCDAILIDVVGKEKKYPELVQNEYSFTQELGKIVRDGGYPGLISPSARDNSGINVNIFKEKILSKPQLFKTLIYQYNTVDNMLTVRDNSNEIIKININKNTKI